VARALDWISGNQAAVVVAPVRPGGTVTTAQPPEKNIHAQVIENSNLQVIVIFVSSR
jgi:hypothetical protein